MNESFIDTLIIIHATFGGMSLLGGAGALATKKGSLWHRRSGKVFFYSLLISAVVAIAITFLPGHESSFLFAIGIFTLYLIFSGYRALQYGRPEKSYTVDRLISVSMLLVGLAMILYPVFSNGTLNIVLSVFGAIGIALAIQDLLVLQKPLSLIHI